MVFSSIEFLFYFLPVTLILYFLSSKETYRFAILSISSLFFYYIGEASLVFIMLSSIVVDFTCGKMLGKLDDNQQNKRKRKWILFISVLVNLSLLFYFKYCNFFVENVNSLLLSLTNSDNIFPHLNIILPLGISFYTFQSMSYTIDVYRGVVKPEKNFVIFCAYVSMFPQLVAGPIVRYKEIRSQFENYSVSHEDIAIGIKRFIIGLSKKVLIANNVAPVADSAFSLEFNELNFAIAWIGIIAYSLQIFFDFSGYSDMAIGLGRILGFKFPENFNFPYIAKSIQEFWRRWHITLSNWFKDYLYIPLGGNRNGSYSTYRNLLIVFFVTGFWHGAEWTFILWGMFHGVFLILERGGLAKILKNLPSPVSHVYTLLIIIVGWVFFRAESIPYSLTYLKCMFNVTQIGWDLSNIYDSINLRFWICFYIGIIFSTPIYYQIKKKCNNFINYSKSFYITQQAVLVMLLIVCILSLSSNTYNPFLYYRF